MYPSNGGPLNDHNFVFVAQGLHSVPQKHESGEAIRTPKAMSEAKIFSMIRSGELTDGQSLGALLHYKLWRESNL
jgi:hypothetical protein